MTEKIKLLFVDDEKKFLESMTTRLRKRNIEVIAVDDGKEALAAADRERFDVALLDLRMPGMDGEEVLARLKQIDPSLEVVILTGHGSIQSAKELTRMGADEYLLKPCEIDELITAITNAYAKRVRVKGAAQSKRVQDLLDEAVGLSPLDILRRLRELDRE